MNNFVKEKILELEITLLKPEIRKSSEDIEKLLAQDFIELCSSGKIYKYSVGDTFYEENVSLKIIAFDLVELSKDCVLAIYKLRKENLIDKTIIYTNRSSVWKCFDGKWKMVFHQGTITNK